MCASLIHTGLPDLIQQINASVKLDELFNVLKTTSWKAYVRNALYCLFIHLFILYIVAFSVYIITCFYVLMYCVKIMIIENTDLTISPIKPNCVACKIFLAFLLALGTNLRLHT